MDVKTSRVTYSYPRGRGRGALLDDEVEELLGVDLGALRLTTILELLLITTSFPPSPFLKLRTKTPLLPTSHSSFPSKPTSSSPLILSLDPQAYFRTFRRGHFPLTGHRRGRPLEASGRFRRHSCGRRRDPRSFDRMDRSRGWLIRLLGCVIGRLYLSPRYR